LAEILTHVFKPLPHTAIDFETSVLIVSVSEIRHSPELPNSPAGGLAGQSRAFKFRCIPIGRGECNTLNAPKFSARALEARPVR
jgi:hypothetical protein